MQTENRTENRVDTHSIAETLSNFLNQLGVQKVCSIGINQQSKMLNHLNDQDFELLYLMDEDKALIRLLSGETDLLPTSDLVIIKIPDQLSLDQAILLLGIVRNNANCPICFINRDKEISFNELIGLGFIRQSEDLFTYDIASYNKVREWNNSRFWANPELFNKYWW